MADWNPRANELFLQAAELLEPVQRDAYLNAQCAGDAGLRQQVESLLAASVKAGSFLEKPNSPGAAETQPPSSSRDSNGAMVGPYKLLQKIGEGGMGSVWVAEQEKPVKRRVALKLIRSGMDSVTFLRRFEAERQALAIMDHSNIAKVLDASTTSDGRPYFVMELIKGVPITKYCDELHLTLRQRLELFVPVCQAIQHAHQKGIIHRDIKPSNILVSMQDGQPVPKIIDFGVAKALNQPLTEGTLMTEFGAVIGTLEYMSPEQAELSALDVDTRADVYALGVLLYELLTGSTPLDKQRLKNAAFVELLRVIKEEEPPKPSTRLTQSRENLASVAALRRTEPAKLQREVSGELDWIVMRCLEKDRTRRYESASALAQDVQRHLGNEPVLACPPSVGYRMSKWAARNKSFIAVAVIIWFFTLIAFGFSLIQWLNARSSEERAVVERDQANEARRLSNEAVIEKSAALRRSEARRLATTALMKTATDPDLTGPLVQEALAMDTEPVVVSSALAALDRLPRMLTFEKPLFPEHLGFYPCRWFTHHPDGKHLIVPCDHGDYLAVFDGSSGKLVRSFPTGHPDGSTKRMSLSPDGSLLISQHRNHLYVWELATGKLLHDFQHEKTYYSYETAVVSNDGKTLAAIIQDNHVGASGMTVEENEYQIWLWDLSTRQGNMVHTTKEYRPNRLAISPDGASLAAVQPGRSRVWMFDIKARMLRWTKEGGEGAGVYPVVVFSQDSQQVLYLEKNRLVIRHSDSGEEWQRKTDGKIEKTIRRREEVMINVDNNFDHDGATAHVSADHRWLVLNPYVEDVGIGITRITYSQKPICVFDLKEMRWRYQFDQKADPCPMVRVSAHGERVVTLSNNQMIEVWENGRSLKRMKLPGLRVEYFVLSPDGHSMVVNRQDNTLLRIDLDHEGVLPYREQALGHWMLSENGRTLYLLGYSANEYLETLDAGTLKTLERRTLARPNEPPIGPTHMQVLSQGRRVLCTTHSGEAALMDVSDSTRTTRIATHHQFPNGFIRPVDMLALPHFGGSQYLAALSKPLAFSDGGHDICLYESSTGREIMRLNLGFPAHGFRGVDFSRDGRWLALYPSWLGGNPAPPREIQLWDTREKHLVEHIPYTSDFIPEGIALRADGQQLLVWNQNSLHSWDRQAKWRRALSAKVSIKQAILSADGKYAATYSDGSLSLWDLTKDQSIYSISLNPNESWEIQFTAGDTMLLAVSTNKVHLWPLDLSGYLSGQNIPRLTEKQKKDFGIAESQ